MRAASHIRLVATQALGLMLALQTGASGQELIVSSPSSSATVQSTQIVFRGAGDPGRIGYFDTGLPLWILQPLESLEFFPSTPGGATRVLANVEGELRLESESRRQRYIVDADNDDAAQAIFSWHEHSIADADRLMQLNGSNGGDLFIGGTLTQNQSWDLAEAFWKSEPIEAGEIVVVDPQRGDAVRRARRGYEHTLLGVVSKRPAIVLGGGAFSLEALREAWGKDVAAAFELQSPELAAQVLAESAGLREEAERLASSASYAAYLTTIEVEHSIQELRLPDRSGLSAPPDLGPQELESAYRQALQSYETDLFDAVVQRFFVERFASVALAGRVEVKADASFGAIRPGDPLTSSPVAGLAMKATKAGPILGMALEGLDSGSGRVLVLVGRGWYAGEGESLVGGSGVGRKARSGAPGEAPDEAIAARLAAKDGEIEELRFRLAALEARLGVRAARRSDETAESRSRPTSGE